MKKLFFILTATTLLGCEQAHNNGTTNKTDKVTDDRPKKEVEFLKQINNADSVLTDQTNAITRKEALDSGKVKIADFIINKLDGKIESWPAVIHSIQISDGIETTFMIQKTADTSEYSSLILYSNSGADNKQIKDQLKPLSYGDSVLITGVFEKNAAGKIDFEPYGMAEDMDKVFENPKFNFTIISIKKK